MQSFLKTLWGKASVPRQFPSHGNMLFPNAAIEIWIPSPLSIRKPDALTSCNPSRTLDCLFIPMRLKTCIDQWIMNILWLFAPFSWHRQGFRPRCLWKSNWGINRRQQEQHFGHGGCQDAEGWDFFLCLGLEVFWEVSDAQTLQPGR